MENSYDNDEETDKHAMAETSEKSGVETSAWVGKYEFGTIHSWKSKSCLYP